MSFGFTVFFAGIAMLCVINMVAFWADKFRINISGKLLIILAPILWVAITVFILLAPGNIVLITMFVGIGLMVLSLISHQIFRLIDKWK